MLPVIGATIVGGIIGGLTNDNSGSESIRNSARRYKAAADNLRESNAELNRTLSKAVNTKIDEEQKKLELKYGKQLAKVRDLERIINEQLEIYKNTTDIKDKEKIKEVIIKLKEQALKGE